MTAGNGQLVVESEKQFDRALLDAIPETLEVTSLGDGLKCINSETVELTHELAIEILELEEFSPDRTLDQNHVLRLKAAMERGTFLSEQVQLVTCTCEGKRYRMNGQHTCWARLEMPAKYRCPVRHFKYTAKTENDMRRLYASIDRGKARTKTNVVLSYLYDTPEWAGFSKHTLQFLAEGLGVWLWPKGHERTLRDGDDRAFLLMTDHYTTGMAVATWLKSHQGESMKHIFARAPVVGAILATFDKDKDKAPEFWDAVYEGTGFASPHDPRLVLRNNLMQASLRQGGYSRKEGKKGVSGEMMYRWCIQCWNTWRGGQNMKTLRVNMNYDRSKAI